MSPRRRFDLVVVGGGPAGSTLAALVKKYNPRASVLILEKESFPRHHIGESLLPGMIPVLKELGVFSKLNAAGFPRKMGAVFVWGRDRKPWDADFNDLNAEMVRAYGRLLDTEFSWQVLRSRYDQILLDHARSLGVAVRHGWRALRPLREGSRVTGVEVRSSAGRRETLRCRILADCSGQQGALSGALRARRYRPDLKNVAAYAYFKGARWKFEYAGQPDKTKIFICSVAQGWFWYIPIARDTVSVGLVSKAAYVKKRAGGGMREYFFSALDGCREIRPLLKGARLLQGVDPADPAKDFFTAGDWSYESAAACGQGWLAAGDAAFFIDPLLSSGVMMAHLSAHRAAYTVSSAWREKDAEIGRLLWRDYDRFCREVGGSFLSLVRYWYRQDPNARRWWQAAKRTWEAGAPLDLDDKNAFVAVAAGLHYYFERGYTSQSLVFSSAGREHEWQWEGTKLELKRWTRQILAVVEAGFLKGMKAGSSGRSALLGLAALPDTWVPRRLRPVRKSVTFLPYSDQGALRPITQVRFPGPGPEEARPKRLLPASYLRILGLIDGRRSIGRIKAELYRKSGLPRDIVDGQVFRLIKDLGVLGVVGFRKPRGTRAGPAAGPPRKAWELFREGEASLQAGLPERAEELLTRAIGKGARGAWVYALRGEARRHLGKRGDAWLDLDRALEAGAAAPGGAGLKGAARLRRLAAEFDALLARSWIEDRVRIFRAKLHLSEGKAGAAREEADRALRLNPKQSEALCLRAQAARALGDLTAAKTDLDAALAIERAGKRGEG